MALDWTRIIVVPDNSDVQAYTGEVIGLFVGEQGAQGERGISIVSIEKVSTVGLVDTYEIEMSDGSTSTFTVTNGATQWGQITGTLSDQTDLLTALNTKIEDAPTDGKTYGRENGAWAEVVSEWGDITGTLSNQTDLQSALDAKIGDASSNDLTYARKNAAWTPVYDAYQYPKPIFYVDVANGSDTNTGGSSSEAFKTVQAAIDACPYLGFGRIIIAAGDYSAQNVTFADKHIDARISGNVTFGTIEFDHANVLFGLGSSYTVTCERLIISNASIVQFGPAMTLSGPIILSNSECQLYKNVDITYTGGSPAVSAAGCSRMYAYKFNIVCDVGLDSDSGSIIAYGTLTGTMTTQTRTGMGGRIFTGSQA